MTHENKTKDEKKNSFDALNMYLVMLLIPQLYSIEWNRNMITNYVLFTQKHLNNPQVYTY